MVDILRGDRRSAWNRQRRIEGVTEDESATQDCSAHPCVLAIVAILAATITAGLVSAVLWKKSSGNKLQKVSFSRTAIVNAVFLFCLAAIGVQAYRVLDDGWIAARVYPRQNAN